VKRFGFLPILLLAASISPLFAQHRVEMRNMYERLYLVEGYTGWRDARTAGETFWGLYSKPGTAREAPRPPGDKRRR
jgi:hypothetical protein